VYDECTTARRGCVDCKRHLARSINAGLAPLRERRERFRQDPDLVPQVLAEGAAKARAIARQTIEEVYQRMGLS
jgi:tryptophanyl-tRNA synthetase